MNPATRIKPTFIRPSCVDATRRNETSPACRSLQPIHDLRLSALRRSLLGSVSDSGTMVLWDANTQREVHVFDGAHKAPCSALAFSPASELLAVSVGLDKKIICYDTASKM